MLKNKNTKASFAQKQTANGHKVFLTVNKIHISAKKCNTNDIVAKTCLHFEKQLMILPWFCNNFRLKLETSLMTIWPCFFFLFTCVEMISLNVLCHILDTQPKFVMCHFNSLDLYNFLLKVCYINLKVRHIFAKITQIIICQFYRTTIDDNKYFIGNILVR